MSTDTYRQEIIDPGDRASRFAKEICFQSHGNCPALTIIPHQPGNFRGPVGYVWKRHILEQMLAGAENPAESWVFAEEVENDGAGGKPQFFTLVGTPEVFGGLGWEIITMTADDFARSGRFPAIIVNELNTKRITAANFPLLQATFEGYGEALRQAGLVNITGEIAVMRHSITAFCDVGSENQLVITWGAACIGLAHRELLLDPLAWIRPGMVVVGFWEPGYRCNGGTFFTNLILERWGSPASADFWKNEKMLQFVKQLTVPSKSYARTVSRIVGWREDGLATEPFAKVQGIAHITGGGVWGKFGEILPQGVGANLYNMPKPADVLLQAQTLSWDTQYRLTDRQAYGTLHGGCGMLLVCPDSYHADIVIREAQRDGIIAQVVGETTASPLSEIIVKSRFLEGKELSSLGTD